jgi:ribosomal protein S18 acetylase RimI-like enzyme
VDGTIGDVHVIRAATADDIVRIAEFQTEAWNDAYRDLVPAEYLARMTVETRTARWGGRIRAGDRSIEVAELAGGIDGVVSFGGGSDDLAGPRLELMSLYVRPSVRGSGLGAMMLEHALGDRPAVLWVFRDNARAIAFYRRHGFSLDGAESLDEDTGLVLVRMSR